MLKITLLLTTLISLFTTSLYAQEEPPSAEDAESMCVSNCICALTPNQGAEGSCISDPNELNGKPLTPQLKACFSKCRNANPNNENAVNKAIKRTGGQRFQRSGGLRR